jgi:outer membrane protein
MHPATHAKPSVALSASIFAPLGALLAAALLPLAAPAAAASNDLLTILRDATEHDPVFASARFAQQAASEVEPQARSALLPNVSASVGASSTRYKFSTDTPQFAPDFERTFNAWGPALQVTLPIWRSQLWDSLSQAKLAVRQSEEQLAQARADLAVRVAQAYFDVLSAQDTVTALTANKQAVSEQLAQARREFEVGTKTIVDTHEAKARYDQIEAQEAVARGDLIVKQSALRAIIGHDPGALAPLRDPAELAAPQPADIDAWAKNAEDANYTVLAARAGAEIARRETVRARDAYLPTVDLTGTVQRQQANGDPSLPFSNRVTTTTSAVGLQLTVPIYTGDLIQSRVRQARASEERAAQDLESARRTASQAARQAYTGVDYGLAQVRALESAEASAKLQLDSTRLGYQVGVRINLDVLNANTQLFNTQRDLKKARYDFLVNGLRLKAASGTLEDRDVQAVNALLQR